MKKDSLEKILRQTEDDYDKIAQKFSQTRTHFWRELENFQGSTFPEG